MLTPEHTPHSTSLSVALDIARQVDARAHSYGADDRVLAQALLSLFEQFGTLRGMVDELGAYFDLDSLHHDLQDRLSVAMEGTSSPVKEPK